MPASGAPAKVSARFLIFLLVSGWTSLGTRVLAFGMAWEASGKSPGLASLVIAATVAPSIVLPFVSGALADRYGPATVAHRSAACTAALAVVIAVTASWLLAHPVGLVLAAMCLGTSAAFTIPSLGVLPRLMVDPAVLPRALSLSTLGQQFVSLVGPALGGIVVHTFGLSGSAAAEAVGATTMSLLMLRLRQERVPAPALTESLARQITDGLRVVWSNRVLLILVLSLTALAGFVLPVTSFLVPVLARERGWPVTHAGVFAGCYTLGSILVSVTVARMNGYRRPGIAAGAGLALAAGGLSVVSAVSAQAVNPIGFFAVGAGVSLYTVHLAPIMLTAAPATHLARVQAVLLVVQSAPLLIVTLVLGAVADAAGAFVAAWICTVGVAAAAIVVLSAPQIRRLKRSTGAGPSG